MSRPDTEHRSQCVDFIDTWVAGLFSWPRAAEDTAQQAFPQFWGEGWLSLFRTDRGDGGFDQGPAVAAGMAERLRGWKCLKLQHCVSS